MHEYLRRIRKAVEKNPLLESQVSSVNVSHDAGCGVYQKAECNCDPLIIVTTEDGVIEILKDGSIRAFGAPV